jgi:hypothetical protein
MFHVGVAVNSKRTVNEVRSMEIWPQFFWFVSEVRDEVPIAHWGRAL